MTSLIDPRAESWRKLRHEQGLLLREIAEQAGVSITTVRRVIYPEEGERLLATSRAAKKRRSGRCVTCKAPTAYNGGRNNAATHPNGASLHCRNCGNRLGGIQLRGTGQRGRDLLGLLDEYGPQTWESIRFAFPDMSTGSLSNILHRLTKYELIERPARGVYRLTELGKQRLREMGAA